MSRAILSEGKCIEYTPGSAVVVDQVVYSNGIIAVADNAITANTEGILRISGRARLNKTTDQAWTLFQRLYWNSTTSKLTTTPNGKPAGIAAATAASGDTTGQILLNIAPAPFVTVLNNDAATAAPGANDDSTLGYSEGSRVTDVTNNNTYFCQDATATAAIWKQMTEV